MPKRFLASLTIMLTSVLVMSQTQVVEITAEPHHNLVLENQYTRVFAVDVAPHASTLMHRHSKYYVYVAIGSAEFENDIAGKKPAKVKLENGQATLLKGGFAHEVHSLVDTPFRNVTVEILKPGATQPSEPSKRGVEVGSGNVTDTIYDTEAVRVSEIKVMPGATLPSHHHAWPHLAIALADYDLRNEVEGKPAVVLQQKAGNISWVKGGFTHTLTNISDQPARWLTVEFK